jgi:hypothetical protein
MGRDLIANKHAQIRALLMAASGRTERRGDETAIGDVSPSRRRWHNSPATTQAESVKKRQCGDDKSNSEPKSSFLHPTKEVADESLLLSVLLLLCVVVVRLFCRLDSVMNSPILNFLEFFFPRNHQSGILSHC